MPNSGDNLRFQLLVNGEVRNTSGIETEGVLSFTMSWVNVGSQERDGKVRIGMGGAVGDEHIYWSAEDLEIGHEVTIRVLPPGEFDTPNRYQMDPRK